MEDSFIESRWEHFPHEADVGVRGIGPKITSAFEQAAVALTAVITDPGKVEPLTEVRITCDASDNELLFVDWLNTLLYEMDTRSMLFSRFEVAIEDNMLKASAWGQSTDIDKHTPAVEIKAATYAELAVNKDENGIWTAQCIVDV
jgi:tRNA nucleotidyltransferase (CCA-adding enzyme)